MQICVKRLGFDGDRVSIPSGNIRNMRTIRSQIFSFKQTEHLVLSFHPEA